MSTGPAVEGQVKTGVALRALSNVPAVAGGSPPTRKETVLLNCTLTTPDWENAVPAFEIDQLTELMVRPGAICRATPISPPNSSRRSLSEEHARIEASPRARPVRLLR